MWGCAGLDFLKKKSMPTPELKASLHTLILVGKILFDHGSLQTHPETTTQKAKVPQLLDQLAGTWACKKTTRGREFAV